MDEVRKNIYYCSIRFWRMAEFMRHNACKCMCLDIDSVLNKDNRALTEAMLAADVAFYPRFHKLTGNTRMLGGTLFVNNSAGGHYLIQAVGEQVCRFLIAEKFLDKFDQQVIYDKFRKACKKFPRLAFRSLAYPIIDLEFTPEGTVWYPKGSSKNNADYRKRAQTYCDIFQAVAPQPGEAPSPTE